MKTHRITCSVVLIGLLVGCGAPAYMARARSLGESGQCAAAESEIRRNESDPGMSAAMMGAVAYECYKDKQAAIRYMNLSARYGLPPAQEWLAKMGQPIPPADLKGRNTNCFFMAGALSCSSN